jgi:hypothetical protein
VKDEFSLKEIQEYARKCLEVRAGYLDALALAFIKVTGLQPEEIELCEVNEAHQTRWFYRKKRKPRKRDGK